MKSIEERAKEKFPTAFDIDTPVEIIMQTDAYVEGATEQQEVDIEKAYTAFCLANCKGNCNMPSHICEKAELFRKLIR